MPQRGSSFTFAAGNARKVAALALYALGAIASLVTRRRDDVWVFGSGSGLGEGALALYEHAAGRGITRVWLASTPRELDVARARGMTATLKQSWRGFRFTLRAGVIAITHGFGDVNRFGTRGAFVVQLWHGIPLKRIQLDSPVTFAGRFPKLLRWAYARSAANIDLVAAASQWSAARLASAFGLSADRVAITGDPRDDVLFRTSRDDARAGLELGLEQGHGLGLGLVVLYAPTWRDGDTDPTIPTSEEWDAIAAWLEARDGTLVLRPHPHSVGDYAVGPARSPRIRMLDSSTHPDITPVLPAFDLLVTDYSSIAFDFALTGGGVAFLAPDVDRYTAARGLYEPYRSFSGGLEVSTWAELLTVLENPAPLRAHAARLAQLHHAFHDGGNTARVFDEVIARSQGRGVSTGDVAALPFAPSNARATIDEAGITITGHFVGERPTTASLVGARAALQSPITITGSAWSSHFSLRAARWGSAELPVPSGSYQLRFDAGVQAIIEPAEHLVPGLARIQVEGDLVTIAAPLTDTERGSQNQARLEREYRARAAVPEDAVFFESFYGQNASCNPRALDAIIAREHPRTTRYWSVIDASVEVPDGAIALVEGSAEWWRVRADARLLVVNDWLRKRWLKRKHQTVLQTWHGTMLKKIAIDRPRHGLRATIAAVLESRRWDVLLSQNSHSTKVFRSAYRFRGPIWEAGYPRNDSLTDADGAAIRARLGIAADAIVLLYAPTWRDDQLAHIDHLDVVAFTDALGPGYVTLIRGHSRTLRPGRDLHASNVLDVTGYPDVTDLFLAADALITDYSSVMFDFSVTGKPMFFFTPDLAHYRERLRGFYFDLADVAPGPVVATASELASLITDPAVPAKHAARYRAWRERFNAHDDGRAAQRVLAQLVELGAVR